MALIILQHKLGVTCGKCGYTDYPDCSLNFFLQDLRSTGKILKSYMLEEWWVL
jgi:hypothetical protein